VEEENEWKVQTPVKDPEQEKRLASIEKAQEAQTSLVSTLSEALSKTRVECSTVLAKNKLASPLQIRTEQSTHSRSTSQLWMKRLKHSKRSYPTAKAQRAI
jgi:hypothetical protein